MDIKRREALGRCCEYSQACYHTHDTEDGISHSTTISTRTTRIPILSSPTARASSVSFSSKALLIPIVLPRSYLFHRGTKAVGVEFVFDKVVYPDAEQTVHTVRARRLTVVSAGTMGSPLILERSGIGATPVLERAGIEQLVDLEVGATYRGRPKTNL